MLLSVRHVVSPAGRTLSLAAAMLTLSLGVVGCKSRSFDNQSQQKTAMIINDQGRLTGYYFVVRVDKRKRWNPRNDPRLKEPAVCIYGNDFKLNSSEREKYKDPRELVEDKGSELRALLPKGGSVQYPMKLSKVADAIRGGNASTFEPNPLNKGIPGIPAICGGGVTTLVSIPLISMGVTAAPVGFLFGMALMGAGIERGRLSEQLDEKFLAMKKVIGDLNEKPTDCANPGNFESLKESKQYIGSVKIKHMFRRHTPARKFMQWIVDDMHREDRKSSESLQHYLYTDGENICIRNLEDEIANYDDTWGSTHYDEKDLSERIAALESSVPTGPVEGIDPENALPSTYVQCRFNSGAVTIDFTDPDKPVLLAPMLKRLGWDRISHSAQLVDQTNSRLQFKAHEGPGYDFAITVSLANDGITASVRVLGPAAKVVLQEDSVECNSG